MKQETKHLLGITVVAGGVMANALTYRHARLSELVILLLAVFAMWIVYWKGRTRPTECGYWLGWSTIMGYLSVVSALYLR